MSYHQPFIPDNQPKIIHDFGFHKVQRQTKDILIGMIRNYFDSINSVYKLQIPEMVEVQTDDNTAIKKIHVEKNFPYSERKIPIIVVVTKGCTERKMHIGADNLVYHDERITSTGKVFSEVYHGAADVQISLAIVTESPESRMQIAELLNICFTHYYRWQYFYTLRDGNMFTIVPNTAQLEYGNESEIQDVSADTQLYLSDLSMKSYVEYTYKDLDILGPGVANITIDENSGPLEL